LRYFVALSTHRHFGRAAETCAISQPALSVQVKELEELLGAPLVERGARQLHLTSLGEVFATRAQEILTLVGDLSDLPRTLHGDYAGRLRIGIIPTVAPYFFPKVFQSLSGRFPRLEIHPREALTRKLLDGLLDGQLDAAIVALPITEPALTEHALLKEEFVLVRPGADAGKPAPNLTALREMRLLLLEEGHCFRDQALSFCKMAAVPARDLMEGSSLSTLVQLVGSGIGVTLIPEMAVALETLSAPVTIVRLPKPGASRTIGMVWRKTSPLAHQFTEIADAISRHS
jgi:LysR family transcriptional regulator, hydrogen peroxide-inducible genes activator